jgi:hypothetical protein
MQTSIYIPDTERVKKIMEKAKALESNYGVSFSELVWAGLEHIVKAYKPKAHPDFRTAKEEGIR